MKKKISVLQLNNKNVNDSCKIIKKNFKIQAKEIKKKWDKKLTSQGNWISTTSNSEGYQRTWGFNKYIVSYWGGISKSYYNIFIHS